MNKTKERENLIRQLKIYLPQLMLEILRDPDFGLEIREEIKKKLERIRKKKVKFFSEKEVKKKLKV
jgi:hypothetical protein